MQNCAVDDCQKRLLVAELDRWKANHKEVVMLKRGVSLRLKDAVAALQQIYDICKDNSGESCDQRMALYFVRQIACDGFEKATRDLPRKIWNHLC